MDSFRDELDTDWRDEWRGDVTFETWSDDQNTERKTIFLSLFLIIWRHSKDTWLDVSWMNTQDDRRHFIIPVMSHNRLMTTTWLDPTVDRKKPNRQFTQDELDRLFTQDEWRANYRQNLVHKLETKTLPDRKWPREMFFFKRTFAM